MEVRTICHSEIFVLQQYFTFKGVVEVFLFNCIINFNSL